MTLRIRSVALALALSPAAFRPSLAQEEPKPIVDVRFDAPFRQIATSMGDEWAPTWGRDDVLYTGNDDGASFGGISPNNITFGKLEGSDPYKLKGVSVNGMTDFREPLQLGPEGAQWNTLGSYRINGALYRFTGCASGPDPSKDTCLMISRDGGKDWTLITTGTGHLFRNPRFRAPSFIAFQKSVESQLGGEPGEYVYAAAYAGVIDGVDQYVLARAETARLPRADAADWSFQQKDLSFKADLATAGTMENNLFLGPDGGNWKTMNSASVDGVLYMFVTRCTYPSGSVDPKHRHTWRNSSIIKSADNGLTWTRPAAENYSKPMFPGQRFGAPYFVWYGKDDEATVDNADKYVYAVSNDGYFENGDNYVLGRVLRSKLPDLSAADWSFYKTGDGMQEASWTPRPDQATPILTNPQKSSMTGMTYITGLRRYVMVVWHYHKDNFEEALREKDLGTVLEFFEAPKPWGPWARFKSFDTGKLGWYTPIIGQRFQTVTSAYEVTGFLYATGYYTNPEGALDFTLYKLNYMPITLSTKSLLQNDPGFVGGGQ